MNALDDEITGKHALPPTAAEMPMEMLGHRAALRSHAKQLEGIDEKIDHAIDRVAAKFTLSVGRWAMGVIVAGLAAFLGGMFWLAERFAAIDSNTHRIDRLEQHAETRTR